MASKGIKVEVYDLFDSNEFYKQAKSCKNNHEVYAEDDDIPNTHCSRNSKEYKESELNHKSCADCSPENCTPEILGKYLRNERSLRAYFKRKYNQDIAARKQEIEGLKMRIKSKESEINSLEGLIENVPAARLRLTDDAKKALKIAKSKD